MKRIFVLAVVFFAVIVAAISCKKEYSYEGAAGSLRNSFNNCNPIEVSGYYRKGASLASDSFFVTVEVDITKTGTYNISTGFINGFQFAGSGTFQNKGIQKVRLKASGMPLQDTLSVFNCSFDTSTCTFTIQVKTDSIVVPVIVPPAAAPTDTTNTADTTSEINSWHFTDLTDRSFHSGIIDPITNWSIVSPTEHFLNIVGWPGTPDNNNKDTIFTMQLFLASSQIEPGTYLITEGFRGDNFFGYANNIYLPFAGAESFFYFYRSTARANKDFTITIISYDPLTNIVSGSFKGSSQYREKYTAPVGNFHQIEGKFYFRLK
jgi:hypothetical protein